MAFKFNPFTGTFDEVGTGGGGGVPDPLTLNELTVNTLLTADHIHGNLAGSVYIHVKNTDSVPLDAGTPFYITGTVGASDRVEIQAADSSDPAKGPAVGVLETTLAVNGEGNGVILGELFNFDTDTPNWSTNDALYVANGGGLTNVKPTSGYRQIIAYVGRIQQSTGTLVLTGTSIDPVAGSNGQIQFNDNGGFGADTGLSFDKATDQLTVEGDLNLGSGSSFSTTIQSVLATANRTISFPDQTGTVGLVAGATGNIQYNSSGALAGTADLNVDLNWTDSSVVYTGLKINLTNTASAFGSKFIDFKINNTSEIEFLQAGNFKRLYLANSGVIAYAAGAQFDTAYGGVRLDSNRSLNWSNVTNALSGAPDCGLKRDSAGIIAITDGSTGTGYLRQVPILVGDLPAAAAGNAGTRTFVSDSTVAAAGNFGGVVAGTGSNTVPVYSDGGAWRIG